MTWDRTDRVFKLICHGCGREHEKRGWFLSLPLSLRDSAGQERGCYACDSCMQTEGRIAAAYRALISRNPEDWQRFQDANWFQKEDGRDRSIA